MSNYPLVRVTDAPGYADFDADLIITLPSAQHGRIAVVTALEVVNGDRHTTVVPYSCVTAPDTTPGELILDPVKAFLAARPHYDPAHVREIARACDADGIPFCAQCTDFHHLAEEHTEN